MEECVFCKMIKGEIPCEKIYENDKVLSFLDINPVNKGHALVIPKEHYKDCVDTPDNILEEVAKAIKKVAKAIKKAVNADGLNIGSNNGEAAGQAVMHFHMHIIPRYKEDGLTHWPQKKYEEGEMNKVAKDIKSLL